jgi:hypothetical protein
MGRDASTEATPAVVADVPHLQAAAPRQALLSPRRPRHLPRPHPPRSDYERSPPLPPPPPICSPPPALPCRSPLVPPLPLLLLPLLLIRRRNRLRGCRRFIAARPRPRRNPSWPIRSRRWTRSLTAR